MYCYMHPNVVTPRSDPIKFVKLLLDVRWCIRWTFIDSTLHGCFNQFLYLFACFCKLPLPVVKPNHLFPIGFHNFFVPMDFELVLRNLARVDQVVLNISHRFVDNTLFPCLVFERKIAELFGGPLVKKRFFWWSVGQKNDFLVISWSKKRFLVIRWSKKRFFCDPLVKKTFFWWSVGQKNVFLVIRWSKKCFFGDPLVKKTLFWWSIGEKNVFLVIRWSRKTFFCWSVGQKKRFFVNPSVKKTLFWRSIGLILENRWRIMIRSPKKCFWQETLEKFGKQK